MQILDRTALTSSDKLDLLAKTISCQERGAIKKLSELFNISRKSIYKVREAANEALASLVSESDEPKLIASVSLDKAQLNRTIVALAITAPNSIRAIEELIPQIYPGGKVSYGYIQGVIVLAQLRAVEFNLSVSLAGIDSIAIDEMFSQGDPALAGIDLDSGYLLTLSHELSRDGDTWARALNKAKEQGLELQHVVKDGALGMTKAVNEVFSEAEQRDDAFHALYITGKALTRAEKRAYRYIAQEDNAAQELDKATTKEEIGESRQKWNQTSDKCQKAIERYESAVLAFNQIRHALRCIHRKTGKLMTVEMAQEELRMAVKNLRLTKHKECDKAAKYIENRITGLTLATAELYGKLQKLVESYGQEQVELACRFMEARREYKKATRWRKRSLETEMLGSYHLLLKQRSEHKSHELLDELQTLLQKRHRASSAIEGFNATLRSYLYVRKGVNQGFLELFQARHNLRERRWGRRKGTSAYESLTGKKVTDWLSVLGFPPSDSLH